jgi:hypothetical protein
MRTSIFVAGAVLAYSMIGGVAARADGPWCAEYSRGAGTNCGFHTYRQCLDTISGVGGTCRPNPGYSDSRRSRSRD